jgi:hypothetical protein
MPLRVPRYVDTLASPAARLLSDISALLRGHDPFAPQSRSLPIWRLARIIIAAGLCYGCAMGASSDYPVQLLYSALKLPLLIVTAALVCLPGLLVATAALGLGRDAAAVVRAILASQATLTIRLASLAPLLLLAYASFGGYAFAVFINGTMFLVALSASRRILRRHYAPLVARAPRHRTLLRLYLVLQIFVSIQTAWVLRPFVGAPSLPPTFFREGAFTNAYVAVADTVAALLWR